MADTTIGVRLTADDGISPKVKSIKQELREAQALVVQLTDKFGATSKEVAGVAQYAAQLKDKMQDATKLIDAFNPDTKFKAFGASIQTVVGGFTALTGAMGLLGVESEEVQKTLLKVQSALAISQGVAQLQEGVQSFKNLGAVILNTLGKSGIIGIAIAGVTALGLALAGVFSRKQNLEQQAVNESLKEFSKAAGTARQVITDVKIAFEQFHAGLISKNQALKVYNDTLGDSLGKTKDIAIAEKFLADKAETYIKITALKAQANVLFARAADAAATALLAQEKLNQEKFSGGLGNIRGKIQSDVDALKKSGQDIENLAGGLLRQASGLAGSAGINTGGPTTGGTAKTPGGKAKEAEVKEIGFLERFANDQKAKEAEKAKQIHDVNANQLTAIDDKRFAKSTLQQELQTKTEENQSLIRIKLAEAEAQAKVENMQAVAGALSALSELFGTQTAAGKVLAIASATINTYLGATKALAQGGIVGIAGAVAVIAAGLASVKKIISVKVPKEQGSASVGLSAAPLALQRPVNSSTTLDQQSLNAIGNATSRSFILEADVANSRERVTRLNRAARLG